MIKSYQAVVSFRRFWMPALGLAFLLIVLIGMPVNAQSGTIVKVDAPPSPLDSGATSVVNIRIENANNLAGAEIHLAYNQTILEVVQLEAGGFPAPDFVAQNKFSDGKIDYAIAQMPQQHKPVSGNGILLKITFKGRTDGNSDLKLTNVVLADAAGKAIPATVQNGSIKVGTPTPVNTDPISTFFNWLFKLLGLAS